MRELRIIYHTIITRLFKDLHQPKTSCLFICFFFLLVNLALKKPTFEQNPFFATSVKTSNAVDGLKSNLVYSGGECSSSMPGRSATWWVNLTTVYSINNIRVYMVNGIFMYILL